MPKSALFDTVFQDSSAIEIMPNALYGCDTEGVIQFYNQKAVELWGKEPNLEKDRYCGSFRRFLMDGTELSLEETPMAMTLKTGIPTYDKRAIVERPDGTRIYCQVNICAVRSNTGTILGAINAFQNVTERVELELKAAHLFKNQRKAMKNLEKAIKNREEFFSIASHELKTPLTSMKIEAQSLLRKLKKNPDFTPKPQEFEKITQQWCKQIDRLDMLINEMLDVSRISKGRLQYSLQPYDLSDVLTTVLDRFSECLALAGCNLKVNINRPVLINCDPLRIEQVFSNLIGNAIRYAPGTEIDIGLTQCNGKAIATVRDHGPGIAEKDQKRIFGCFERAIQKNEVSGLGLGLYISKKIVADHGGQLSVESRLSHGANFIIELPLLNKCD